MSKSEDIRWIQRLQNLGFAFKQFEAAVEISKTRPLSELEQQGLIQTFEFTHELCLNVMKDYFDHQGSGELITGSRDASREAFNKGLIQEGAVWMEMIKSRNQTSHTYNKKVAAEIVQKILSEYAKELRAFLLKMNEIASA